MEQNKKAINRYIATRLLNYAVTLSDNMSLHIFFQPIRNVHRFFIGHDKNRNSFFSPSTKKNKNTKLETTQSTSPAHISLIRMTIKYSCFSLNYFPDIS